MWRGIVGTGRWVSLVDGYRADVVIWGGRGRDDGEKNLHWRLSRLLWRVCRLMRLVRQRQAERGRRWLLVLRVLSKGLSLEGDLLVLTC